MKERLKERPILFSGAMVRAILEGRKTQTRRLARPDTMSITGEVLHDCPHGLVGDRLWVREAFRYSAGESREVLFAAGLSELDRREKGPWKPGIHMPRGAARLLLEVTASRVERLQELTDSSVIIEGVDAARIQDARTPSRGPLVDGFANLWDSLNAARAPWDSNPWVWVVTFKRVS